ncbi:hypothetical protein TNCV_394941 [Trichonephila clavipes]|nr:hypothetical protein TNCV_394941 [Trichonephila clavipes]
MIRPLTNSLNCEKCLLARLPGLFRLPKPSYNRQQCLSGHTEERYHQPIDRSGLTPASRLQLSVGQRFPMTPFSSLRDAAHGKYAGWETNGVSETQLECGNQRK